MTHPYSAPNSESPQHDSVGSIGGAYQSEQPVGTAAYPSQHPYGYVDPVQQPRNKLAPWALGLSIIALVCSMSMLGYVFGVSLGIVGLVLGIVALLKAGKLTGTYRRRGMAVSSIVLSVLALAIGVVFGFLVLSFLGDAVDQCGDVPEDQIQDCVTDILHSKAKA